MEISIKNFKAISSVDNLELRPLNVLCGTNSVGKTSFVQALLMLKQTLESSDSDNALILNNTHVKLGKFKDVLHRGSKTKTLDFNFYFDDEDLYRVRKRYGGFSSSSQPIGLNVSLKFKPASDSRVHIDEYTVTWELEDADVWMRALRKRGSLYEIDIGSNLFVSDYYRMALKRDPNFHDITIPESWTSYIIFNGIFPQYNEGTSSPRYDSPYSDSMFSPLANIYVKKLLGYFLENISYIGPLRNDPQLYYVDNDDVRRHIGSKGDYAAQLLARHSGEVEYYRIDKVDERVRFVKSYGTLESAVRYWMCDVFNMAKNIRVVGKLYDELYKVLLKNEDGIEIPITHVGFGISQVFPIVVEGLRIKSGSTLILEQPEIHLHPKVQSLLFDFLHSLTLRGIKVIIETHSDHFVTRLRRRVAEDLDNDLIENMNLIFVEKVERQNVYSVLNVTELGTFEYWPADFFDQLDAEYRAIMTAQLKRNISPDSERNEVRED